MSNVDSVSSDTAKLLKDVTGESSLDSAVRMTLRDAMEHRLELIEERIKELEEKYGMDFQEFEEAWSQGDLEDRYSYDVESDYWKWEGLVTRKKKIEEAVEKFGE